MYNRFTDYETGVQSVEVVVYLGDVAIVYLGDVASGRLVVHEMQDVEGIKQQTAQVSNQ